MQSERGETSRRSGFKIRRLERAGANPVARTTNRGVGVMVATPVLETGAQA